MRKWTLLLGGLTVWAVHFFLLYAFVSIFPGTEIARVLTLVATIPALAANALLLWLVAGKRLIASSDHLDRWVLNVAAAGAILSLVAVLWQALPALMV